MDSANRITIPMSLEEMTLAAQAAAAAASPKVASGMSVPPLRSEEHSQLEVAKLCAATDQGNGVAPSDSEKQDQKVAEQAGMGGRLSKLPTLDDFIARTGTLLEETE